MKLYIDTSSSEKVTVRLDDKLFETSAREQKSQRLLSFLEEVLTSSKKAFGDIDSIEVKTGPGSFTGLRVGVSVANTLGWVLGVKVNGEKISEKNVITPNY